jgi:probable HAF family extracellular repeat protein
MIVDSRYNGHLRWVGSNRKAFARVSMVALTLIFVATAADAPKLTLKFNTVRIKASQLTEILGTNNAGVLVGSYIDSSGTGHGFMLRAGRVTNVDDPKGTFTNCFGINLVGDIVGAYSLNGALQGFLFHAGKFKDIGPAGSTSSEVNGINDQGHITGYFVDTNGVTHGFLWSGKNISNWMRLGRRPPGLGELVTREW